MQLIRSNSFTTGHSAETGVVPVVPGSGGPVVLDCVEVVVPGSGVPVVPGSGAVDFNDSLAKSTIRTILMINNTSRRTLSTISKVVNFCSFFLAIFSAELGQSFQFSEAQLPYLEIRDDHEYFMMLL